MKRRYKVVNHGRWEMFKLIVGSAVALAMIVAINQLFGIEAMMR